MSRTSRRAAEPFPEQVWTIAQACTACRFRSLVSVVPGTQDELLDRVGGVFVAIGGKPTAIDADTLADLVDAILAGKAVLVMSTTPELQHAARGQIMAAVNLAAMSAAGSK